MHLNPRTDAGPSLSAAERRGAVAEMPFWWHAIDVGDGVVTPGHKSPELLSSTLEGLRLPDLAGKSVLDIGAWDGFFSFATERLGAARVVALDHYVWSLDMTRLMSTDVAIRRDTPAEFIPGMWRPDTLPGKRGFDIARRLLGSGVESIVADFMTADLDGLGRFDVVMFLGVLYHMRHPLLALERLAQLTRTVALIETHVIVISGHEDRRMCEFYPGSEFADDPSNWWTPTVPALIAMCEAAGFARTVVTTGQPDLPALGRGEVCRYPATVQAWKA